MRALVIIAGCLIPTIAFAQTPYDDIVCKDSSFTVRSAGIVITTNQLDKAVEFYSGTMGLPVLKKEDKAAYLQGGDTRQIVIKEITERIKPNSGSQDNISFTLLVNNIDSIQQVLKKKNVKFVNEKKRTEGVGYSLHVIDPENNIFSILQDTLSKRAPFSGIRLYNYGYYVSDMVQQAKLFCGALGFVVLSKRYLPGDIPLGHRDKRFAFMLHLNRQEYRPGNFEGEGYPAFHLLFSTDDPVKAKQALMQSGCKVNQQDKTIFFRDSFGLLGEMVPQ